MHGESKRNDIGFLCRSDSKPQKILIGNGITSGGLKYDNAVVSLIANYLQRSVPHQYMVITDYDS